MKLSQLVTDLSHYPDETEWLEFKQNYANPEEIGEYISAIANAAAAVGRKEGYVIWGVSNDRHDIVGTSMDFNRDISTKEPLQNFLACNLSPSIAFKFEETVVDDHRVVVLTIPAASNVPVAWQEKRYGRIGSSKVNLAKYPERESLLWQSLRNGVRTIVNTPSPDQDLTFQKLFVYYGAKGIPLSEESYKESLHLLTEDGSYNILAQLVSDNSRIPVRFSIFDGTSKASNMYIVKEFGNDCLFYTIDRVLDYGEVLNQPQADERHRVGTRVDIPLFDQDAYNEAVINAFIHNDWLNLQGPMFTAYSDRIEILSRGGIPSDQTMDGFYRGVSKPRCPELAKMFIQLHMSEATGRGVPRIVHTYGKSAFEFGDNFIVATLTFHRIHTADSQEKELVLSDAQKRVLAALRDNPNLTIAQLAIRTSLSFSGAAKILASLKTKNLIERIGNNRTGYWKILIDQ